MDDTYLNELSPVPLLRFEQEDVVSKSIQSFFVMPRVRGMDITISDFVDTHLPHDRFPISRVCDYLGSKRLPKKKTSITRTVLPPP